MRSSKNIFMLQIKQTADHFVITIPRQAAINPNLLMELQFYLLSTKWKSESQYLSFTKDRIYLDSYQAIIDMGKVALPFIFREMEQQPQHWFVALKKITNENPVLTEHQGDIKQMTKDWLQWAKKQEII